MALVYLCFCIKEISQKRILWSFRVCLVAVGITIDDHHSEALKLLFPIGWAGIRVPWKVVQSGGPHPHRVLHFGIMEPCDRVEISMDSD